MPVPYTPSVSASSLRYRPSKSDVHNWVASWCPSSIFPNIGRTDISPRQLPRGELSQSGMSRNWTYVSRVESRKAKGHCLMTKANCKRSTMSGNFSFARTELGANTERFE